jgi:hypothetical protein
VSGRDGCGSVLVLGVLEEANRLGLLRTVGPAYQFRHAALQDRLAPHQPT